MAQHDMNIANQGFPATRSDINNALSAINSTHSGSSRPSGAVAGTIWLDTTSATSPTLKYYDGADDISLATIDHSANTVNWLDSTVSITGLATTASGTVLTLSDSNILFAKKGYFAEQTLTDGATIDWNLSTQQVAKVTLAGNRTLNAPTNQQAGAFYSLAIIQDGTGSRTLTFNSAYKFTGATAPTLTTTASAKDIIIFKSDGTNLLEVGRSLNIG
ncbi:hypothetical protein [uncultured Mediterranean phage uvMED]|nr:hypothetical protein [uncultured Mediterranean phage uvMED]